MGSGHNWMITAHQHLDRTSPNLPAAVAALVNQGRHRRQPGTTPARYGVHRQLARGARLSDVPAAANERAVPPALKNASILKVGWYKERRRVTTKSVLYRVKDRNSAGLVAEKTLPPRLKDEPCCAAANWCSKNGFCVGCRCTI